MMERLENPPESTWGREPSARVGNFTCPCGNVIIDGERGDDVVEVDILRHDSPPPHLTIKCDNCGRKWWLKQDGPYWRSSKTNE